VNSVRFNGGVIHFPDENFAEIIVDEGVEVQSNTLREVNELLSSSKNSPKKLLVNKVHNYSYSFECQFQLLIPSAELIAVVIYEDSSKKIMESVLTAFSYSPEKIKIFSSYGQAKKWLLR
jgi:hypothetical protein